MHVFYYIPSENFLERKKFNSMAFIFLCPQTAHHAQSSQVCRIVGVLYNTCVGCHRGSEAIDRTFYVILDTR